jgi:hypothetical protein
MIEVGLLVVANVENIKIVVLEGVFSGALKANLTRLWQTEGLDQLSWNQLNLSCATHLATSLVYLSIVAPPGVILREVPIASISDYGSSCSLILLIHQIFE